MPGTPQEAHFEGTGCSRIVLVSGSAGVEALTLASRRTVHDLYKSLIPVVLPDIRQHALLVTIQGLRILHEVTDAPGTGTDRYQLNTNELLWAHLAHPDRNTTRRVPLHPVLIQGDGRPYNLYD